MEVLLRPVPHLAYEPVETDAISCTYDMDGFTLMNAVLIQHGLDREHFRKCAHMHSGGKFRVISHGDEKPLVITTTKTERWNSEPSATQQVIDAADAKHCESLCMTHFAFILGKFPEEAFAQCMQQIKLANYCSNLQKVVVDVDSRHFESAQAVQKQGLNRQILADTFNSKPALQPYLILGLGSSAKELTHGFKPDLSGHSESHNFRIGAMDASEYWLDGFDFDRQSLEALVDTAQNVLFVVHADSADVGATMVIFATEYAVSQKISVDVLLSKPYSWEGGRRMKAVNTLIENLRALGAKVTAVDADSLETIEFDSATEAFAALDAAIVQELNRWAASAK
jgi:hypothetical protein